MLKLDILRTLRNMDRLNFKDMTVEVTSGEALVFSKGDWRLVVFDDSHFKVVLERLDGIQTWSVCCNELDKWGWGVTLEGIEEDEVTGLPSWVVITHDWE